MEDRRRGISIGVVLVLALGRSLLAGLLAGPIGIANAEPLDRKIPDLFGGGLAVIAPEHPDVFSRGSLEVPKSLRSLSAALSAARGQAPAPSASGAFRFEWDSDLDTFIRREQSLGPLLAERTQTLGRKTGTLGASYTHIDFDTLEGINLAKLSFPPQPAFAPGFFSNLCSNVPPSQAASCRRDAIALQDKYKDKMLQTQLQLGVHLDLIFFTAAYGITDSVDLSVGLSVNRLMMAGVARATIDPPASFLADAAGRLESGSGKLCGSGVDREKCATDAFDGSAFGTGDVLLRAKWHFADTKYADFAVAGVLTVPTGNADDFLGLHDPTFTPWLIASKSFGRIAPHVNLGYALRSGKDVSQAEWIAGADFLAIKWLTLNADFLGFHDDKRDGMNDDVLQSAVGFKANPPTIATVYSWLFGLVDPSTELKLDPFSQVVIAWSFQFPLNRDGLRADVIYTGQVEWTF